jgi:hypothetical protein
MDATRDTDGDMSLSRLLTEEPKRFGRRWWHARRGFLAALVASLAIHAALSFVPDDLPAIPDAVPLTASIRELPPPPSTAPAAKPKSKPKPKPRAPVVAPEKAPEVAKAEPPAEPPRDPSEEPAPQQASAEPPPVIQAPEPEVLAEDVASPAAPELEQKTLPPRVDLSYKVFWGTQGFEIGRATYRFEHADNRYRIFTIAEARGLAALLFRGQGRMESLGTITASGLQPNEFFVDKFNSRGMERAEFDWETGIATLHDAKTAPLEIPTFDILTLMWQYYFQPPDAESETFALATTRRVIKVTVQRERVETIEWANGPVETEVWRRTSEDGRTDAYVWLAPSLRWIPVKMRVVNTMRGTVEALLQAIRVDEQLASTQ